MQKLLLLSRRSFSTQKYSILPKRALLRAVEDKNVALVEELLRQRSPQEKTIFGNSPITRAAGNGATEILERLLEHSQEHEVLSPDLLQTALTESLAAKNYDCTRILMQNNAQVPVHVTEQELLSPLGLAFLPVSIPVAVMIALVFANAEQLRFGTTLLHKFASEGHLDFARRLLAQKPALLNHQCDCGMSPLHIAAQSGHVGFLKFLAEEKKANLNLKNIINETAYDTARRHNKQAAVYLESIGVPHNKFSLR